MPCFQSADTGGIVSADHSVHFIRCLSQDPHYLDFPWLSRVFHNYGRQLRVPG